MVKALFLPQQNESLWPYAGLSRDAFMAHVWEAGAAAWRDLPWRGITDAYGVLVSEVMLQQTQVVRVLKYWDAWMRDFPTPAALAEAPVAEVLTHWQGLGYNRRALALQRAAQQICTEHQGCVPADFDALTKLSGIGSATAAGVLAFAFERPAVYVETNVRAVFIHELFSDQPRVPDCDLVPFVADIAATVAQKGEVRAWNYALLDYGAALKRSGVNPTRASTAYTRQSAFEGSRRQKRAALLRMVLEAGSAGISCEGAHAALCAAEEAAGRPAVTETLFTELCTELEREGFIRNSNNTLSVK